MHFIFKSLDIPENNTLDFQRRFHSLSDEYKMSIGLQVWKRLENQSIGIHHVNFTVFAIDGDVTQVRSEVIGQVCLQNNATGCHFMLYQSLSSNVGG